MSKLHFGRWLYPEEMCREDFGRAAPGESYCSPGKPKRKYTSAERHAVRGACNRHSPAHQYLCLRGYTDAKGSDAHNQGLSERRAAAVERWFKTKGNLKNVSFVTQGFGAKNPVAPNTKPDGSDDPAGRQKNRRVEIVIQK